MKTVETKLPAGRILEIKVMPDGSYKVVQEVAEEVSVSKVALDYKFILIEAESLSMDDEFMKYQPRTKSEENMKKLIEEVINKGVKNFYRPIMDPSFTDDGENICFEKGRKPAVGKSYNWWKKVSENFSPERNSRLGTRLEYGAFLGVLIKKLVAYGASISWAWNAVCNDSKELGHYWDSENAKHNFESTGSRCICGFYDLANTYKILAEDEEAGGFWLAGSDYCNCGYRNPLADLGHDTDRDVRHGCGVGWLVLS